MLAAELQELEEVWGLLTRGRLGVLSYAEISLATAAVSLDDCDLAELYGFFECSGIELVEAIDPAARVSLDLERSLEAPAGHTVPAALDAEGTSDALGRPPHGQAQPRGRTLAGASFASSMSCRSIGRLGRFAQADSPRRILDREQLLSGATRLLGDWFPEAHLDDARRASGIAFQTAEEKERFRPESQLDVIRLGELTPAWPRLRSRRSTPIRR